MQCDYFDAGLCRSCTLLDRPYPVQVAEKEARVRDLLGERHAPSAWLPALTGPESGFRNKAKMVVGGTIDEPTLGILDGRGQGVDLRGCGLHTSGIQEALPTLAAFVTRARLLPYDVPRRRGEAKYVHVTESPSGELMVRFVLRSEQALPRLRSELPWLLEALPRVAVVSVNLLPEHKAVLEGTDEIVLTDRETLTMHLGGVDLELRPQSFFQTNTAIAAGLYAQAAEWVDAIDPATVWDLYCGVGGFALHVARPGAGRTNRHAHREVVGIETSEEAVASARGSARRAGLEHVRFAADDATRFATGASAGAGPSGTGTAPPELVIVNPPRRGIGATLAGWLEGSGVEHVVYSSCNPVTLASDLDAMPSFDVVAARVFDMFPQTPHLEAMALLRRR
ncbi:MULTISPECIES: 23S rRNA (uracil(747)-C(5))-methyltransferase RlmC [unclassified Frigoribacterium]|uniref:23S rRNA (uracil(747)-C(5))-methyltransferase RlmC n=1 Tax=unclassified Frigoribacterium TaxID=2627005 RepID=UPI001563C80B|nr:MULTISPECIES: 23S rRNA (uracil(747)-C(5))-methyltransferase RlmC [unclassified Frigoribacterium]NQW87382.1 23S rRNA (uracil(747)-C(5))-methyltransferase RlmC [Frigoribacterium sp. VKM Ac-2860]NQX09809.1 23S rRNA (uracil(747)-C(5))-methyltransferase RlmC [Frigoribacterium sp. VKM Ac-2859]